MKKICCVALVLVMMLFCSLSFAEVSWNFPVPMIELDEQFIVLVNTDRLLDEKDKPSPLVNVKGVKKATNAEVQMQETAAAALKEMFEFAATVSEYEYVDAKGKTQTASFENGMTLYLKSGYRSYGTQKTIYANHLQSNGGKDDGYVQKPGASEHQTGLCADILNATYAKRPKMTQDFEYTPEAQWMRENCAQFGFILRYTENESVTGIAYEPWHFRYVGKAVAAYIMEEGITLEEFTEQYEEALADFLASGGSVEEQIAYENKYLNALPESRILEDCVDEDGDCEVTLDL